MAKLKIQWVKQYLRTCVLEFCTFLIYPLQNNNVKTPTFARPVNGNLDGKSLKFTLDMLKLRRGAIRDSKYIQPFAKFLLKLYFWTHFERVLRTHFEPALNRFTSMRPMINKGSRATLFFDEMQNWNHSRLANTLPVRFDFFSCVSITLNTDLVIYVWEFGWKRRFTVYIFTCAGYFICRSFSLY